MKNIHILPTDKPSRLCNVICTKKSTMTLFEDEMKKGKRFFPKNIYITNGEQAKEGDWGYIPFQGGDVKLVGKYFADDWKKIILTTDQDLIKDGVQAIEEDFLNWFVKNPSSEEVEMTYENKPDLYGVDINYYKIIIPKEPEPDYTALLQPVGTKQETLEEAAISYSVDTQGYARESYIETFIEGAKWKAERSYSEEEVLNILNKFCDNFYENSIRKDVIEKWFNQFKKK